MFHDDTKSHGGTLHTKLNARQMAVQLIWLAIIMDNKQCADPGSRAAQA
jgi:hypothetical protein